MPLRDWASILRGKGKSPEPLLILESLFLGVIGALGAQLLLWAINKTRDLFQHLLAGYHAPLLTQSNELTAAHMGPHGLWLMPLATTLGGLISGLLIAFVAEEVEGHGTDKAIRSFHRFGGRIRARVPPTTLLSASAVIGSGGSAGREGPIISISGGIGSILATWFKRPEEERSLLLLVGMASGLAAIYRAPIGAAIFPIEALYETMEFETAALVYTVLAAIVSWVVDAAFVGWRPLFNVPSAAAPAFHQYGLFAAFGVIAGVISAVYPVFFYAVRDGFNKLRLPLWSKPALGGLLVGLLGVALPQILGGGYGWMQMIIDGRLALGLLAALIFAKIVGLALTVGSGGTGGVFAPSLFIGACLGGAFGRAVGQPELPYIIMGMAAVFGSACRCPLTGLIMILEMTSAWALLPATALAVWISYMVQVRLTYRAQHKSLYEDQVPARRDSPAHYAEIAADAAHVLGSAPRSYQGADVAALLRGELRVPLVMGRELETATLADGSALEGKTIEACYQLVGEADWEILGLLRGQQVFLPFPGLRLEAKDRLAVILSDPARERLARGLLETNPSRG